MKITTEMKKRYVAYRTFYDPDAGEALYGLGESENKAFEKYFEEKARELKIDDVGLLFEYLEDLWESSGIEYLLQDEEIEDE